MALYTQDASGWLKVVDRGRVCVYLLSGTAQCSAADPVTGQIKQASLTGGRMAECTVRFEEQGDSRCEIDIRDFTEEAIEGFVLEELAEDAALSERLQETFGMEIPVNKETAGKRLAAAGAEWSKHMEQIRQESCAYAALRDPVWKGEAHPSYAMENSGVTDAQDEEQPENAGNSPQSGHSGSSGQTADPGVVPVIRGKVPPVGTAPAAPQSSSPSKKKGGSGSSASDEKKPEEAPFPAPDPAGPTENQGLVVEGIAHNGPQGVIEVQEGGRVHVESGELFRNEGKLASSGTIDGGISNEGGEFRLTGGTVSGITQKKGSTSLEGGTVNGSLKVLGGELRMSGGTVPELTQNGGTLDLSDGVINGGCEVKDGTFRMSGGTVADMAQTGGNLRVSGGAVNGNCTVEGGEFCLAGGTVPDMVQKKGTISVVSGSCTVEGGGLRLSGGTVAQMIQRGGQFSAWSVTGQDSGAVIISDTTITTSELLSAEGRSTLTIRDSVLREGVAVRGSGTVEITDSEIDGRIETGQNGRMEIKDCRITAPAGTPEHTYIKNTENGTLRLSGTDAKPGGIENTGSAVLTLTGASKVIVAGNVYNTGRIQVEDAELLSNGGEITNQGTMNLTGGTVARVVQKGGVLHMENGTITDGCTVTGGKFEMLNGKVESGSADAALKVDCSGSETAGQNGIPVTEENANVTITGGTVLGTGTKKAFDVCAGRVWIANDTAVKAEAAVNTIAGDTSAAAGSWGVQYSGYQMQPEKPPVLYVTRKEEDGMMRLRRLEDDFEKVAKAEDGDVITLSGDATGVRDDSGYPGTGLGKIELTGGSETAPVTLDLNGNRLREMSEVEDGATNMEFRDTAVWKIENGEIQLEESGWLIVNENSNVTLAEIVTPSDLMGPGIALSTENSGTLTIKNSILCVDIASYGGSVHMVDSELAKGLDGYAAWLFANGGTINVSNCKLELGCIDAGWDASDTHVTISDSSMIIRDGIALGVRGEAKDQYNLNISRSSIEIMETLPWTDEVGTNTSIYNNGGEINLTDISMLKMPGDIQAVGGITRIAGAASGCELTASNIDIKGELSISGCSMKDMGNIRVRLYGSLLDISNCTMENMGDVGGEYGSLNISNCTMQNIGNISGGDSFSITNCTAENIEDIIFYDRGARDFIIQDCYMKNTGMIRIPGGISERGKRIISNSILEGVDGIRTKTDGDQTTCISNSTVSLNKPMNLKSGCTIDGNKITCTEEFQEEAMIKADWLEVIGDTVLHPNKNGVIPICQNEYEKAKIIIGGNARVIGDGACALRLFGDGETTIRDNAELVSANSRGTVLFDDGFAWSSTYIPKATLYLNGGKAVNTGTGSVVSWESQKIFSDAEIGWKTDTEVKSRTEPVLAVGGAEYMPDGYEIVENDGYYYLCMLPEQVSLERQADDQAAAAGMGASLEEESTEDTEGREADLTVEEELLTSDSDSKESGAGSAESEGKPEDGTEPTEREEKSESRTESSEAEKESESDLKSTEDEKDPESDSEPTEDKKDSESELPEGEVEPEETGRPSEENGSSESSLLPSADSDTEGAGDAPSSESDGSGDSSEPSEKDRRTEDAVLPPDKKEALKKEESESDQSGR